MPMKLPEHVIAQVYRDSEDRYRWKITNTLTGKVEVTRCGNFPSLEDASEDMKRYI